MKTEEAITQAVRELQAVAEIQANNIAWCIVCDLKPGLSRKNQERYVEDIQMAIETVLTQ